MDYDELFKATLTMFALDKTKLSADDIRTIFKEVLKAHALCKDDYGKRPHGTSVYNEGRVKTL